MNSITGCMGSKNCKKIAVVEREYRGLKPLLPNLKGIFLCNDHKDRWPWDTPEEILKEIKLEGDENNP